MVSGLGARSTRRALKNAADPIYERSKQSCERQVMTIFVGKAIVSLRSVPSRSFLFPQKNVSSKGHRVSAWRSWQGLLFLRKACLETKQLCLCVAFLAVFFP